MNYIKPEDIKEYVSKNPTGIAGMSEDLTNMINYFVERSVRECILVCEDHKEMYAALAGSDVTFAAMTTAAGVCAGDIAKKFGID